MNEALPQEGQNLEIYVWLVVGWTLYFSIHSLLATDRIKSYFEEVGISLRAQRLVYTFISVTGLLILLILNGAVGGKRLIISSESIKIMALFLGGGGVLVINAAFKQYDLKSFLGFKQEKSNDLQKSGILAYVRHPLYSGTILVTLGFFFYDPRLATAVSVGCIYVYLTIGIYLEEKKLTNKFGQLYIDYKHEVPALFPNVFKLFKKIS